MLKYFNKFLIRQKSSKIVCLNEPGDGASAMQEGKAGSSQESSGSVDNHNGVLEGGESGIDIPDQTIRRDLTKSLSYDYLDSHKVDDIYVGKHRPLISKKYEIEDVVEEPIYDEVDPVLFQTDQFFDIKHYSDGSKSTIFEAKIEHFCSSRVVILKTLRIDDSDVKTSVNDFIYERDLLLSLRYFPLVKLTSHSSLDTPIL